MNPETLEALKGSIQKLEFIVMSIELTDDQIRLLAQAERNMDGGMIPFVCLCGHRVAVRPEIMSELDLRQGQTITDQIFRAILRHNIAWCEAAIAIEKAKASGGET